MKANRTWSIAAGAIALWIGLRAPASAQVTLSKVSDLDFGSMVSGASPGTVTVATSGAISTTGGVTLVPSSTSAASFSLANPASGTGRIYFIGAPGAITINAGANSMTVNSFQVGPPIAGILAAGASRTISLGATLNVGANQASGTYTGSFLLTVNLF